ncbi:MAG TPA: citrate synthase [Planctomycetaceae bacterium]|nr:citrate synthase [Planctomycetaceae bacterium]
MGSAKLSIDGKEYEFPTFVGTEGELGIDISALRTQAGAITFDPGLGNTGLCRSAITFIDGEKGILRYRGYPIEQLAETAAFSEVAYLLIYGELPNAQQLAEWRRKLTYHSMIHEDMKKFFDGFPPTGHPMAMLSAMVASLSTYYPDEPKDDPDHNLVRLLAKLKTIAAYAYKKSVGQPMIYPRNGLSYAANFLNMMFAVPAEPYEIPKVWEEALNAVLILHADHEQNCSTSTVRVVGSSQANLFASISAGICALWGPLHGGANLEVIEMLEKIRDDGGDYKKFVAMAKDKKTQFRLMGFGHRVYKNFDPRARILRKKADEVLSLLGINDPLLEIAKRLEEVALKDEYFIERKLYPNVDFYSGIIYRAMGIPTNMFTVLFALGRLPGWIAHWREQREEQGGRINRPRQIYTGPTERPFVPLGQRG